MASYAGRNMKTRQFYIGYTLVAGILLCGAGSATAQPPFDRHPPRGAPPGHPPGYHGTYHFAFAHHDFAHFLPGERAAWLAGRWAHAWHNGRYGWWWFAGGAWYFYAAPVFPYPTYVSDYYVDDESGPPMWYYCGSPPGYYPYIPRCTMPWQPVPAQMPQPQNTPGNYAPGSGPGYDQTPTYGPSPSPGQPPSDPQR